MSKDKTQLVPKLRFPEFKGSGEWEKFRLECMGDFIAGLTYSPEDIRDEGLLVLRSSNIQGGEISLADNVFVTPKISGVNISQPNDILICVRNGSKALIGKSALIPYGLPLCTHGAFMIVFRANSPNFAYQLFQTRQYQSQVEGDLGATINSINVKNLRQYCFLVPPATEQQKIAECLSSLDDLIKAEGERLEALRMHKKGLMQNLFPQQGETTPRLRFPEFKGSGEWKFEQLNLYARRIVFKNSDESITRVLTNSAVFGVVDQRDFFDKDIAIQGRLAGYSVVDKDDFVYNPRISANAPVGPISRNKVGIGAMSPLYTIFRFEIGDLDFYEHYFNSNTWHPYVRSVASSGARYDRISISTKHFDEIPIPIPEPNEQQRIADCLSSLDDLITAQAEKIDTLKLHKKGLMQGLFPKMGERP